MMGRCALAGFEGAAAIGRVEVVAVPVATLADDLVGRRNDLPRNPPGQRPDMNSVAIGHATRRKQLPVVGRDLIDGDFGIRALRCRRHRDTRELVRKRTKK